MPVGIFRYDKWMAKFVPIHCPRCNKRYRLPELLGNKQVICKRCQHKFRVDGDDDLPDSPDAAMPGSIFDALDVDNLLNAPSSGLEKAKRKQKKPRQIKSRTTSDANNVGRQPEASPEQELQPKLPPPPVDPDPELIEDELEFAWAKKRKQQKQAKAEQLAASSGGDAVQSDPQNSPELDDEELAIYAAVTRQNRRRNIFCAIIAAAVVILVGGFFANQEYKNLSIPLTVAQRDWLTDRGFMLKARRVVNINGAEGAAVEVAAGKSFADIDKFSTTKDDSEDVAAMDSNRLLRDGGNARNRQRNDREVKDRNARKNDRSKILPLVDFDTQVDFARATIKPTGPVGTIAFSSPVVSTASPRGQFYVAGPQFIKGVSSGGEVFEQRTIELTSGLATAIVATADGRRVIVGGELGEVHSYRLDAKGRLTHELTFQRVHRDKIIHLLTSSDSKRLVVYSADGRMSIWDLETQHIEVNTSDLVPQERLQSLRLIEDAVLISSSEGIRRFEIANSSMELEKFDRGYRLLSLNNTGEKIAFSTGARLGVIDAGTKRVEWNATMRIFDEPRVEFSPDRITAFYFDGGRSVLHFEISSGRLLNRFGDDRLEKILNLSVSADGKTLLVSGTDDRLYQFSLPDVIDVVRPTVKSPLPALPRNYPPAVAEDQPIDNVVANAVVAPDKVSAMCLSDDGFLIAATKSGRTVVYDWIRSRVVDERFETGSAEITFMTTVGNKLLLGRESGLIETSKITPDGKLNEIRQIAGQLDRIKFIGVIPDSPHVVSVTESGHTRVWDLLTGAEIYDGRPLESRIQSVAIDRRSDVLLADGDELATLDYKSGVVRKKKGDKRVLNVNLLPDGKRLAFFDRGKLKLATTSRGEVNLSFDLPSNAKGVSFSPDAKFAFVFAGDEIIMYRLRGAKELLKFKGPKANETMEMIFSADGKFMTPFYPGINGSFNIYAAPQP